MNKSKSNDIIENISLKFKKLSFFNKLSFKFSALVIIGILLISVFTMVFMSNRMYNVANEISTERIESALNIMNNVISDRQDESIKAALIMASDVDVINAVKNENANDLRLSLKNIVDKLSLDVDFITISDNQGTVIARTHSDKTGDSVLKQVNVSDALSGKTSSYVETGTEIKISIRTGTPVKNEIGQIIGVISTGYSFVDPKFVDLLKEMTGNEFTIFLGDERINSTIMNNGERVIGTKSNKDVSDIVINGRENYFGQVDLFGVPHITAYTPIIDSTDKVIGMYFTGISLALTNDAINTAIITSITIVIFIVLIIVISLVLFVSIIITKPLSKMMVAATALSDGNMNVDLTHKSNDELGILADSLKKTIYILKSYINDISEKLGQLANGNMRIKIKLEYVGDFLDIRHSIENIARSLNTTLNNINIAAEQVSSGSDQVSVSAQALAQGATEQASSIEELSSTIVQISSQVLQNAKNSNKARELSQTATVQIKSSNEQMQDLMLAINDINEKSSKIKNIIKTIEGIAFQTNILALNAAVEAARAGTAGKGFAVVADEVRKLALESSEAAKNTTDLIEISLVSIEKGVTIAKATANNLIGVVDVVKQTSQVVTEISEATNTQSSAIEQVTVGINQISNVVQSNSATSQESAAASEELSSQAAMLNELVSKFQLE